MPRMIELVRKSQMSANMMQAAARGALMVSPGEMIEILVHLALHNRVFGEQARMTLAGWDEKASLSVAADAATSKEVLDYWLSPRNTRPVLLPALLGNPSVPDEELTELAKTGSRTIVEAMLVCKRVHHSPALTEALRTNPRLRANELAALNAPRAEAPASSPPEPVEERHSGAEVEQTSAQEPPTEPAGTTEAEREEDERILAQAIDYYLQANAAELAAEEGKPFEAVRLTNEELPGGGGAAEHAAAGSNPVSAGLKLAKRPIPPADERRDSTLQKIAKLDVKGRIALAMRGSKEERSILIPAEKCAGGGPAPDSAQAPLCQELQHHAKPGVQPTHSYRPFTRADEEPAGA